MSVDQLAAKLVKGEISVVRMIEIPLISRWNKSIAHQPKCGNSQIKHNWGIFNLIWQIYTAEITNVIGLIGYNTKKALLKIQI